MRTMLLLISVVGMMLFGALLSVTFVKQRIIAEAAKDYVAGEIKAQWVTPEDGTTQAILKRFRDEKSAELAHLEERIVRLDEFLSSVLDKVCNSGHCNLEQTSALTNVKNAFLKGHQAAVQETAPRMIATIDDMLTQQATALLTNIIKDIRIFLATNLAIFCIVFLATYLINPVRQKALALPSGLLVLADSLASFIYIFEQNWFFSILTNNYWGTAYIGLVLFIVVFLFDIVMNKARITNVLLRSLGGSITTS